MNYNDIKNLYSEEKMKKILLSSLATILLGANLTADDVNLWHTGRYRRVYGRSLQVTAIYRAYFMVKFYQFK